MISKDLLRLNVKNMESAMNFPDMDKTQLRLSYSATNLNSIERSEIKTPTVIRNLGGSSKLDVLMNRQSSTTSGRTLLPSTRPVSKLKKWIECSFKFEAN